MKVFLYSPYIPKHFGGGEKYLLDVARVLAQSKSLEVTVAVSQSNQLSQKQLNNVKKQYANFFNINLNNLVFVSSPLGSSASSLKKALWTKKFDIGFYLTDGSLFFSLAKKNILHIQVPLKEIKHSWLDRLKLKSWHKITTNSYFTKSIVEPNWKIKVDEAHQPMIDVKPLIAQTDLSKKEKIILNVGRFFPQLHSKRQDIMATIFARLINQYKKEMKDWKLVFVGGVEDQQYLDAVKKLAVGLPIEFVHDANNLQLQEWYKKSSIYWHATGYRIDPEQEPHKVEHFGISTVEAMASGCVPVVIAKGGQREVLGDELLKWSWLTQRECIKKTKQLAVNKKLRQELQIIAQRRSLAFAPEIFVNKLSNLINNP